MFVDRFAVRDRLSVTLFAVLILLTAACRRADEHEKTGMPPPGSSATASSDTGGRGGVSRSTAPGSSDAPTTSTVSADDGTSGSVGAAAAASDDSETSGSRATIEGTVTLRDSGKPAEGARVVALNLAGGDLLDPNLPEIASAAVDAKGRYRLKFAHTRVVLLCASRKGSARMVRMVAMPPPEGGRASKIKQDFALEPAATLRGRVVDADEKAVQDAQVAALARRTLPDGSIELTQSRAISDAEGAFVIDDAPAGTVGLSAWREGFAPWCGSVDAPKDDVVIRLAAGGAVVEGRVFLKSTGEAVARATVTLAKDPRLFEAVPAWVPGFPKSLETDASGAFKFEHLPEGTYFIRANKETLFSLPAAKFEKGMRRIAADETVSDVNIFLFPGYTLRGRVTERGTGKPIEGVLVSPEMAADSRLAAHSDADGNYELANLPSANLSLRVEKAGYTLVKDQPYQTGIRLALQADQTEATKNIEMLAEVTISGRVTLASGGPAVGARVGALREGFAREVGGMVTVDDQGRFRVSAAPFSSTRLQVESAGYPPDFSDLIALRDKAVEGVEIVLWSPIAVSGVVVDPEGKPVSGAEVRYVRLVMMTQYGFFDESPVEARSHTNAQGEFRLAAVPHDSDLSVAARKEGYAESDPTSVPLKDGETEARVRLTLNPILSISGRTVDSDGEPVEGVHLNVSPQTAGSFNHADATSDGDGRFTLPGLGPGTYVVNASHPDHGHTQIQNVAAGKGDVEVVMEKALRITLVGKVIDGKTEKPIADFNVMGLYSEPPRKDPDRPGVFIAEDIDPNSVRDFVVSAPGYVDHRVDHIPFLPGKDVIETTIRMSRGAAIAGRVVGKRDGAPLAGVRVLLLGVGEEWELQRRGAPEAIATTGDDGRFLLSPAIPGANMVSFEPEPPLVQLRRRVTVSEAGDADMGDVALGGGGVLRVRVVRGTGETPVAGEFVQMDSQEGQKSDAKVTDAKGVAEFPGLSPGTLTVSVSRINAFVSASIAGDETQEVTIRLGAASIRGIIVKNGKPAGAHLSARGPGGIERMVNSDSDGSFVLGDLAAGTWSIEITQGGGPYAPTRMTETLTEGETLERTYTLVSGRIRGRVVDEADQPVSMARVHSLWAGSRSADEQLGAFPDAVAVTNAQGEFILENLRPGSYTVTAQKDDVGFAQEPNVVVAGEGDGPALTLRLKVEGVGTLVSTALKMSDGKPLREAWCRVFRDGAEVPTTTQRGDDGVIRLAGLAPGAYQVEVSSWGFSIHRHSVEIVADKETVIEDVLYDAGAIRWTLQGPDGVLEGVECALTPVDPTSIEVPRRERTDNTGLAVYRGLFPGDYRGEATLADGRKLTERFTVIAHEVTAKTTEAK